MEHLFLASNKRGFVYLDDVFSGKLVITTDKTASYITLQHKSSQANEIMDVVESELFYDNGEAESAEEDFVEILDVLKSINR